MSQRRKQANLHESQGRDGFDQWTGRFTVTGTLEFSMSPTQILTRIVMCILSGLTVGGALMIPAALLNLLAVSLTDNRAGVLEYVFHPLTGYFIGFVIGVILGVLRVSAVASRAKERHRPLPTGLNVIVGRDEFAGLIGAFVVAGGLGSIGFAIGFWGPQVTDMAASGAQTLGYILGFVGAFVGFFLGLGYGASQYERERSRRRRKIPEVPGIDY